LFLRHLHPSEKRWFNSASTFCEVASRNRVKGNSGPSQSVAAPSRPLVSLCFPSWGAGRDETAPAREGYMHKDTQPFAPRFFARRFFQRAAHQRPPEDRPAGLCLFGHAQANSIPPRQLSPLSQGEATYHAD